MPQRYLWVSVLCNTEQRHRRLGWVDEDRPLQYRFGWTDQDQQRGQVTRTVYLCEKTGSNDLVAKLPVEGRKASNYAIRVLGEVHDYLGPV